MKDEEWDRQNRIFTFDEPLDVMYPRRGQFSKEEIEKADWVKAVFTEPGAISELLWVLILERFDNRILGIIGNETYNLRSIKFRDIVEVFHEAVVDLYTGSKP